MAEAGSHTWSCPSCGRRVPRRVETCHCGLSRARAEELAAAAAPAPPRPGATRARVTRGGAEVWAAMPRDVKALVSVGTLVMAAGLGWLIFGPQRPPSQPRVLGWVDAGPPPAPLPTPRPQPPFPLPWWR